ncbi:hypothetical protein ACFWPU_16385 [Streptomyces sp. NPDC058471]|uniref:hypothetical protein n=1 Tax=Streptomyces sp. NPDC058471 TaxID=3346516 RepID=UPI003665EC34
MTHDGNRPTDEPGDQPGGSLGVRLGGVRGVGGHYRGALYGFTLRVSALTVLLGCAIVGGAGR